MENSLVLVSGPPGSGKTSVAVPLARALGFQLLTKDAIKEALGEAIPLLGSGQKQVMEWSRLLGAVTYEVLWSVAPHFRELVLESNFLHSSSRHLQQLAAFTKIMEVFCDCPLEEAQRRFRLRAASRHGVHVDADISLEKLAQYSSPLGLGPVLRVDTTKIVDIDDVTSWVRRNLRG